MRYTLDIVIITDDEDGDHCSHLCPHLGRAWNACAIFSSYDMRDGKLGRELPLRSSTCRTITWAITQAEEKNAHTS